LKLGPGTPKSCERQHFEMPHNPIYNGIAKTYRYGINRGEEAVTFNLSFKRFDLVLDFRDFNYREVKINNYTQNLL
jgi:hypothetical protein